MQRDFVYSQYPKILIVGFAESFFQKGFVNVFDRFWVKVKMLGNFLDGQHLAKIMNVSGQSVSDSLTTIAETQMLYSDPSTGLTPDFTIFDLKPNFGIGHVQVANNSVMLLRMNGGCPALTVMADWPIPQVGAQFNQSRACVLVMDILSGNFYSHKRKIFCNTKFGHCATPFVLQVPLRKELIVRKAA
jgi:hypothetical protein